MKKNVSILDKITHGLFVTVVTIFILATFFYSAVEQQRPLTSYSEISTNFKGYIVVRRYELNPFGYYLDLKDPEEENTTVKVKVSDYVYNNCFVSNKVN